MADQNISRDLLLQCISRAPDIMLHQFTRITLRYLGYILDNIEESDIQAKLNYINEQFNAVGMLSKIISISSSGQPIESQLSITDEMNNILKNQIIYYNTIIDNTSSSQTTEEDTDVDNADNEYTNVALNNINITGEEMIKEELEAWGIVPDKFAYKVCMYILQFCKSNMTYNEIIDAISNKTRYKPANIVGAFVYILKHADFSKSKYITVLAKMKPEDITREFLVNNIKDFCE